MKKKALPGYILILFSPCAYTQEEQSKDTRAISFEASYIGENANVLHGGIKTGSCYLGMANILLGLSTGNAGLWKGGELFLNTANTHGASPSSQYIGDYQVASNIEAGNHTFIQELWFRQNLGPVAITAGLQDLNVEFFSSENGSLYLNSSFGVPPTITGSITASVFPLTTPGLTVNWTINEKLTWINAIYDGSPTDFENNHFNMKWKLNKADGVFVITEVQSAITMFQKPGKLKAGLYDHHHRVDRIDHPTGHDSTYTHKVGFYILADQVLWQHTSRMKNLSAFCQFGLCPDDYYHSAIYVGSGLNYQGLFFRNGNDALGLAMAYLQLHDNAGHETSIELTYRLPVARTIYLQPDIQYIIDPAGSREKLENCLVVSIRFGIGI